MIKVYGSEMCPDCQALKRNFDHYHIEYLFLDINENLRNLKEFLIYRDSCSVFDHLKAIHDIGLPACIGEDNTVFTDWEGYLTKLGFAPLQEEQKSCSLDHKGC